MSVAAAQTQTQSSAAMRERSLPEQNGKLSLNGEHKGSQQLNGHDTNGISSKTQRNQGKKMDRAAARKQTVLEQHCGFFDRDGDGVIWPTETFATCRSFDWSIPLSLFFTAFLHTVQSWGTVPWWHGLPDPLFRIWVANVRFNKHGSSTMAFDNWGNLTPARLDEWIDQWDEEGKGGLTFAQGWRGVRGIKMVWDVFGQVSAFFEWGFTYVLLWPEDGVVKREDAHRVLDGSIFHDKVVKKSKDEKLNGVKST